MLDEPTAVLTPGESTQLYTQLRQLVVAGQAVVVVTHKLDEVLDHADRITVLRQGRDAGGDRRPARRGGALGRAAAGARAGA